MKGVAWWTMLRVRRSFLAAHPTGHPSPPALQKHQLTIEKRLQNGGWRAMMILKVGWAAPVIMSMMHAAGRMRILSVRHGPAALVRIRIIVCHIICRGFLACRRETVPCCHRTLYQVPCNPLLRLSSQQGATSLYFSLLQCWPSRHVCSDA